jgi:hypothetical protein
MMTGFFISPPLNPSDEGVLGWPSVGKGVALLQRPPLKFRDDRSYISFTASKVLEFLYETIFGVFDIRICIPRILSSYSIVST